MAAAVSGAISRKANKRKAKAKPRRKAIKPLKPLQPLPSLQPISPLADPQPQPQSSLFGKLLNRSPQSSPQPQPSQEDSLPDLSASSVSCEIPPAVEAVLAGIPDTISEPEPVEAVGSIEGKQAGIDVSSISLPAIFTEQSVASMLKFGFDAAAKQTRTVPFFGFEFGGHPHWKLDDEKLGLVVEPTTAMLNQGWQSIRDYLPTLFTKAMESNPHLCAFVFGWGIVLKEMVAEDQRIKLEQSKPHIHEFKPKEGN